MLLIYWQRQILGARPIYAIIYLNLKLWIDPRWNTLGCKSISLIDWKTHLSITRLDISFVVRVVCRFMQAPRKPHMNALMRILRYLKKISHKSCYIEEIIILQLKAILMQLGLVLLIEGLPLDISHFLEEILWPRKVKSKVQLQSIEQCLILLVIWFGFDP